MTDKTPTLEEAVRDILEWWGNWASWQPHIKALNSALAAEQKRREVVTRLVTVAETIRVNNLLKGDGDVRAVREMLEETLDSCREWGL